MTWLLLAFLSWFGAFFRSRHDLGLELVALRQQVGVLKRKNPRPQLSPWDRLFRVGLRRGWSKWASVLVVVKPETVVGWHRAGFREYWHFLSRRRLGRPKITPELCDLIRSMAAENPCAPQEIASFVIFCSLFKPLPSPAGIRDADRPGWEFRPPGHHTEYRSLKRVAPACLLRVQESPAPGSSVGGPGC